MTDEEKMESGQNWVVREQQFDPAHVRKYESILCQGNGYLGIRAAVEEDYEKNVRYTLVAGTFDRMERKNTTELPNSADTTAVFLTADGIALSWKDGSFQEYERSLDLRDGMLHRRFLWTPREGLLLAFSSERFVSLCDRHVTGQRISVKVLEGSTVLSLKSGIRGGERYGDPHFEDMESRLSDGILQYGETTHQSGIVFVTSACVQGYRKDKEGRIHEAAVKTERQQHWVMASVELSLEAGEELVWEKLCRIATTRDCDFIPDNGKTERESLFKREQEEMLVTGQKGYETARRDSVGCWARLWQERDMVITGQADEDQLAFRFAVYHLTVMAPLHDHRMNIGAKGLSGKGYMGHTFWDTEIYMLPYFIWEDPRGARSLLEYRYFCLDSARQKARENGYEGAMYPWESAWITDGDVCPEQHFAQYEYHVTADVAYGVCYYYEVTHDVDFMCRYGCEILFETAQFWKSRLEYCSEKDRYEICNVIGPDEFTHQADNNAFTNYLAHLNLLQALIWQERLQKEYPQVYAALNQRIDLEKKVPAWRECAEKLFLPKAGEDHILPQDDTWFSLPEIDLSVYRAGERKLRQDYPYPSYTKLKVSKQADVMNLFLLREELFSDEIKRASLDYYEPFCVHESSLSLCTYSMLAADCGEQDKACGFFRRARAIDLGPDMNSSNDGIHAASLGGIWQCCVLGFCGIRLLDGHLCIRPHLPDHWQSARLRIWWRGSHLEITVTHGEVTVEVLSGELSDSLSTSSAVRISVISTSR